MMKSVDVFIDWAFDLFVREKILSKEFIDGPDGDVLIHTNKARWRGACTVYHNADTGRRAGTDREVWLSSVWRQMRCDAEPPR